MQGRDHGEVAVGAGWRMSAPYGGRKHTGRCQTVATPTGCGSARWATRFREQTGTTPLLWLHRVRIRHAQYLLEATTYPIERIVSQVGIGSPTAFRDRFKRIVGTSPHAYRAAFQATN